MELRIVIKLLDKNTTSDYYKYDVVFIGGITMSDNKEKREYMKRITNAMNRLDRAYLDNEKFVGAQGNLLFLLYAIEDGLPHTQKGICVEWMIPRTTLNSVVKKCEREGYVTLKHVAGTRRELEICLTDAGVEFANKALEAIHWVEDRAITETLKEVSPNFIDAYEYFVEKMVESFEYLKKNQPVTHDEDDK